jgi:hypothetical protein
MFDLKEMNLLKSKYVLYTHIVLLVRPARDFTFKKPSDSIFTCKILCFDLYMHAPRKHGAYQIREE